MQRYILIDRELCVIYVLNKKEFTKQMMRQSLTNGTAP